MKLTAAFLLVIICECNVYAWWWTGNTRITHECTALHSIGQECGNNPYCPYPYQKLRTSYYCCCMIDKSFGYQYKMTLITAQCGLGVPKQECQDFPYCEEGTELARVFDRCCCVNYNLNLQPVDPFDPTI